MTPNRRPSDATPDGTTPAAHDPDAWEARPWADADELHEALAAPIESDPADATSGEGSPDSSGPGGSTAAADGGLPATGPESSLSRRPRRKLVTPVTAGLSAVILLAAGFTGGVLVQKHRDGGGSTATAAGPGGFAARSGASGGQGGMPSGMPSGFPGMPGGGSGGGMPGGASGGGDAAGGSTSQGGGGTAAASGGMTVGEVANVKGSTIYVTTSDGTTVRVVAADGSTVQRTSKTSMSNVHPGDSVVVSGTTKSDGTVSATSVTATAEGATAGAAAFGR